MWQRPSCVSQTKWYCKHRPHLSCMSYAMVYYVQYTWATHHAFVAPPIPCFEDDDSTSAQNAPSHREPCRQRFLRTRPPPRFHFRFHPDEATLSWCQSSRFTSQMCSPMLCFHGSVPNAPATNVSRFTRCRSVLRHHPVGWWEIARKPRVIPIMQHPEEL